MDPLSIIIFVFGTFAIALFTWFFSLRAKRLHGIPRLFAFESILVLTLLNAPVWFKDPIAWNQCISWIFLFISIAFAVSGFFLLRVLGKPQGDFEKTTKLVTVGLYRFIRHPLYASLLFLGTGIFLKDISIPTALCAFINLVALTGTAKQEEKEMIEVFGNEYIVYMQKTRLFIPYIV
jgi:protein-S-isoprenylcysteine O-methyltransferase Ste14